jgi:hypothetical protein
MDQARHPPHRFMEPPNVLASVISSQCPLVLSRQVALLWCMLMCGVVTVVVGVMADTLVDVVATD